MAEQQHSNPWKGLQSYQEADIIYGRDEEIKNLYTRVLYDTQTVVYGKSGIGKSSIINAGIIPRAKLDGMLPVIIRLAHTTQKGSVPTKPYIEQIKQKIEEELGKIGGELEDLKASQGFEIPKGEGASSLWELLHRYRMWAVEGNIRKRLIPLLLFDQFEEIFTLETDSKRVEAFFSELADLLNEVKPDYLSLAEDGENTPTSIEQTTKNTENDCAEKSRNVFNKIANRKRTSTPGYMEKSEFHLVITLREDFLPDLERHTIYIPVMKTNRFAILPLNEEQAAKIIMEPIDGLISKPVAKEIIEKVTGRSDFLLDGIPEIEVNASLLSLYMEQLYNRKQASEKTISSRTVIQYGDDIIKNFYEESIRDIPSNVIETLEEELITNADKRDNVARVDLNAKGVDEKYIDLLLEKKVLQQFCYNDDMRVELIHDILCPVVNNRISNREQIRNEEKRRQWELLQMQKLRRSRRVTIIASTFALFAITALAYAVYKYFTKPTTIIEDKFVDIMFVFNPDESLKGDTWEANVEISALKDSIGKMTVLNTNKYVKGTLHIKGPGSDTIMVRMRMDEMDAPFNLLVSSKKEWLCETMDTPVKLEKPNVDSLRIVTRTITLTRDPKAMFTLYGHVQTKYKTPIIDAFVVLGEKLARTNNLGEFEFTMKDSTELMGCILQIFKSEYVYEDIRGIDIINSLRKVQDKEKSSYNITLRLRPEYDSLYYNELNIMDKIVTDKQLTAKDSSYINMYFGDDYYVDFSSVTSPDTTFCYAFRIAKKKGKKMGRTFGYYSYKNKRKPFDGYLDELDPVNGTRRWKLSITAHDSIFNKERITGIIQNEKIMISYQ